MANLYNFVDTNSPQVANTGASEEVNFNFVSLASLVAGYRTLTVQGRELIGRENRIETASKMSGGILVESTLPTRVITVRYQLKAKTNAEFREKFQTLNRVLHNGGEKNNFLSFSDEPYNIYMKAILSDVADVPEGINNVVSTFSFVLCDPYKYIDMPLVTSTTGTLTIPVDSKKDIRLFSVDLTASKTINNLKLTLNGYSIFLTKPITSGTTLTINFYDQNILLGAEDKTGEYLAWNSQFEQFGNNNVFAKQGGTLTAYDGSTPLTDGLKMVVAPIGVML